MKKALLKKELRKLYVETVSRTVNMVIDAEPVSEEDGVYIVNALKEIALQKSVNGEIYDILVQEHPDLKESISKEDFIMLVKTKIQETFDNYSI